MCWWRGGRGKWQGVACGTQHEACHGNTEMRRRRLALHCWRTEAEVLEPQGDAVNAPGIDVLLKFCVHTTHEVVSIAVKRNRPTGHRIGTLALHAFLLETPTRLKTRRSKGSLLTNIRAVKGRELHHRFLLGSGGRICGGRLSGFGLNRSHRRNENKYEHETRHSERRSRHDEGRSSLKEPRRLRANQGIIISAVIIP